VSGRRAALGGISGAIFISLACNFHLGREFPQTIFAGVAIDARPSRISRYRGMLTAFSNTGVTTKVVAAIISIVSERIRIAAGTADVK